MKRLSWVFKLTLLTLVLGVFIGACTNDGIGFDSNSDANTTELTVENAEHIARLFFDGWKEADYEGMYQYISANARNQYSPERFAQSYQAAQEVMNVQGLDYSIHEVTLQGTTAVVAYTITFDTILLGEFSDPADSAERRYLRMISTPDGWRIAWSRMDIVSDWTESTRLTLESTLPTRGNIFDRNGKVLVNQNGTDVAIFVARERMRGEDACVQELSRIFRRDVNEVTSFIGRYSLETVFFFGEISEETYAREQSVLSNTCAAVITELATRQYWDSVASHIIGYIGQIPAEEQATYLAQGYPVDALVGLSGIERAFEASLAGTIGNRLVVRDNDTGAVIRVIAERESEQGRDLYLTIDRDLQEDLEGLIANAYNNAQNTWAQTSRGAAAVVMDPRTGEILAIVSYPTFDQGLFNPNTLAFDPGGLIADLRNDPRRPLLNRAIQSTYPLGSVYKVFSLASGLDSGAWSQNRTVDCNCKWQGEQYGDVARDDWYCPEEKGILDPHDGLVASCNIFFWTLGVEMHNRDPYLLPNYVKRFGFGTAPPFQGIPTSAGLVPDPDWKASQPDRNPWSISDTLNQVIGQGDVNVSPLQVVRGISAIANGGTLYEPMIVKRIVKDDGSVELDYRPNGTSINISPDVLAYVRDAMCEVTTNVDLGTANYIYQNWYNGNNYAVIVCGKTGSAESGGEKSHAWFAAYAPQDNPEIAVVVLVENSCEGSEVAAPIVREVFTKYFGLQRFTWPDFWATQCAEIGPD